MVVGPTGIGVANFPSVQQEAYAQEVCEWYDPTCVGDYVGDDDAIPPTEEETPPAEIPPVEITPEEETPPTELSPVLMPLEKYSWLTNGDPNAAVLGIDSGDPNLRYCNPIVEDCNPTVSSPTPGGCLRDIVTDIIDCDYANANQRNNIFFPYPSLDPSVTNSMLKNSEQLCASTGKFVQRTTSVVVCGAGAVTTGAIDPFSLGTCYLGAEELVSKGTDYLCQKSGESLKQELTEIDTRNLYDKTEKWCSDYGATYPCEELKAEYDRCKDVTGNELPPYPCRS